VKSLLLLRNPMAMRIRVILACRNTRGEIELYRRKMKLADPFTVENGGAMFLPEDYSQSRFGWVS